MHFGDAREVLLKGGRVGRQGWNGKGMYLGLQVPDDYSHMTVRYLYIKTADGGRVPWVASQTDLLAEDWVEVSL